MRRALLAAELAEEALRPDPRHVRGRVRGTVQNVIVFLGGLVRNRVELDKRAGHRLRKHAILGMSSRNFASQWFTLLCSKAIWVNLSCHI